jgi:co-chaperonin GroES (HSP10)
MIDVSKVRMVGPYMLVEPVVKEVWSKGGIIIPATMWRVWRVGQVANIGSKEFCIVDREKGKKKGFRRPDLKLKDIILFENMALKRMEFNNKPYFRLHWYDAAIKLRSLHDILPM